MHANKLVVPINKYLDKDPEAKTLMDDIAPGLIRRLHGQGRHRHPRPTAGTTWSSTTTPTCSRRRQSSRPKADWTWADFKATAKKLTKDTNGDGKPDQYGFTWASNEIFPGIMPWVANAGGNLTSDDVCTATADTPQVNKAVSRSSGAHQRAASRPRRCR